MEREQLERLVNKGLSSYQIADELGKGQTTIRYWLKKHKLRTDSSLRRGLKKEGKQKCKNCGVMDKDSFYSNTRGVCKSCHSKQTCKIYVEKKLRAVDYLGASCKICGYKRYYGALEFHHKDPSEKEMVWSELRKRSWDKIKIELDKCELLCSNCHKEVHGDVVTL